MYEILLVTKRNTLDCCEYTEKMSPTVHLRAQEWWVFPGRDETKIIRPRAACLTNNLTFSQNCPVREGQQLFPLPLGIDCLNTCDGLSDHTFLLQLCYS